MALNKGRVCVTGAGGFVASWVVNILLSKGYVVHGTIREPKDDKYSHLNKFEKASENLKLFKADLLNYDSMLSAIEGCSGVFHVASPVPSTTVPNPEVEVLEPAVKGTLNVLKASVEAKVNRVVFVSSAAAVEAESEAMEFAKRSGLDVVAVCPTLVLGPILQSNVNASSLVLIKLLKGAQGNESMENKLRMIIDVRDLAEALLLAYEKPEAEGRYICTSHPIKTRELVDKLRSIYPRNNYPNNFVDVEGETIMSSEKLQRLGWRHRALDETLIDSGREGLLPLGLSSFSSPRTTSSMELSKNEVQMVEPPVKGKLKVLSACVEAKVNRVVVVSSVTEAENVALEFSNRNGLDAVTVCPPLVLGPILQSTVSSTGLLFLGLLKGGFEAFQFMYWMILDIRDVAEILLLT
ncbi:hypothetical protein FNV43_RR12118 [Rhamnella rubrinervis]|uniref:NAD-dependent epimerase/dehydratase domain-containing protein n=1 Tax=Rhamnella rubrinervis TaxID=2594499 RepID=A0A8K0H7R9_9ROSA|nr:hypothetical protein FNV43_RR12118 [Rhamnella rubrinervis]